MNQSITVANNATEERSAFLETQKTNLLTQKVLLEIRIKELDKSLNEEMSATGEETLYQRNDIVVEKNNCMHKLDRIILAIKRIEDGRYNRCASRECVNFIGEERLKAAPTTQYCIECAKKL